jgi:LmbE family N-acetylglucosaminyl deacetylase
VLAPHPDDESIACAGLLLAARDCGAARSVVVVTDGDNNPWPQRWAEKRWRIDAAARARWGARRRAEAESALGVLDVAPQGRHFLGLPDSELTSLLMRDTGFVAQIEQRLAQFGPTHLALPALADRHPDHSAVHVAARMAIARAGLSPRLLIYAVHGDAADGAATRLALSEAMQRAKREAILRHETQMRLSGKRFLRFARAEEGYAPAQTAARADVPLRAQFVAGGIEIRVATQSLRDAAARLSLLVLVQRPDGSDVRLRFPLVEAAGPDAAAAGLETVQRIDADGIALRIATDVPRGSFGFAKLERMRRGIVIYDSYGWQVVEKSIADLGEI